MRPLIWIFILLAACMSSAFAVRPISADTPAAKDRREDVQRAAVLKKAQLLARSGNYQQALKLLAPFASPTKENAALYSDYIVFHFWAGNARKAIQLYESMPDDIPRRPYLVRNIAKACYDTGDFEKAVHLYADVVKAQPDDEIAKQGLALSLFRLGQLDRATALLQEWIAAGPGQMELELLYAEALFRSGRYPEAFSRFRRLAGSAAPEPNRIAERRESLVGDLQTEQQDAAARELKAAADAGDLNMAGDYLFVRILQRHYDAAVRYIEEKTFPVAQLPEPYLYWTGWAYFKANRWATAEEIFHMLLRRNPDHVRAHIGLAYVHAVQGNDKAALMELDGAKPRTPREKLEQQYAAAYIHEKAGRFLDAVAVYDAILVDYPGNATATRLRLNALSDMGATSEALHAAEETHPADDNLSRSLKARMAVDYIQWNEPEKAIGFLKKEIDAEPQSALRFEYVVALAAARRFPEAISVYETLESENGKIPSWVTERAADAYLQEHQPEKALALYEKILSGNPGSRNARMGKFYALQDLREWRDAEKILDEMEADTRPMVGTGRNRKINPELLELQIARGWMLASEERLRDADEYFAGLRERAPANMDIRNGQAHVASWRGWKRNALDRFTIMQSMETDYISLQPGRIAVLNSLAHKAEAHCKLSQMIHRFPQDRRFRNVDRSFEIEGMHELLAEIQLQRESDGTNDFFLQLTESTPLSLYTRLHAFQMWRRTWNTDLTLARKAAGEDEPAYFRRAGIGFDHIFNDTWELRQQFSFDYVEGGDFGSYTRLRITPDDHWRVDLIADTFTIDVPARARIRDITAVKTLIDTVYRESEWREYSLRIGRQWFSDGNDRDELLAGISQYYYVKNDWKLRLSGYAYYGMNSEYDDPAITYFNPRSAWGLSITHMIEQILWQRYERFFIHRLYLSAGNYAQNGYGSSFAGSVRYEQDHAFTDTHHLMWAIGFGRNVYDGDPVNNGVLEIMYQWRF